jgi:hypothetical protein
VVAAFAITLFFFSALRSVTGIRPCFLVRANLAGAEGFEPPSSVLETDSLTVELTPLWCRQQGTGNRKTSDLRHPLSLPVVRCLRLLCFFVWGVLAAAITELLELEAAGGRLFVLRRRVIALFALATLQCDNLTHFLILPDSGEFFAG